MVGNIDFPRRFVVDASFVLSYLLPDEENDYVKEIFSDYQKRKINFITATLLPYEVVNGVKSAIIRKRMSVFKARFLIGEFSKLDFDLETISENEVLKLALARKISIYDASYVWLAKSKKIPLLTLDEKLQKLSKQFS
ncbi:MAG: VapC-type toxin [Microgenomates group bacterium GW2011_GWC1_37_8]|uniref:VapC-type toxin n=1 Tax=Candidatus Woesebacteria bacterium GW2011_GWB1_38_8 TaxID=1618570 RepID=A0A0G0NGG6_9BACT|nr:MAG: VapC-type toxin [Microgenomates group bacterium GW2011_GWC1_37_8]KKQ84999.1 MAG: VapC-type toxin [Candidatus Woesebacteria bacterium GW2011_GWB1_38_8]